MGTTQVKDIQLLYVEDDDNIRKVYERYLKRKVKNLFVAINGQEGFDLYVKHKPDLIVTDIKMPIMDGLEMSRKIRTLDNMIPIIVTTAHTETEFFQEAITIGVNTFLLKPVDMVELANKINDASINLSLQVDKEETNKVEIEADKMVALSELLCNIAHQWRQPLAAISAASFNIQFKLENDNLDDDFFSDKVNNITQSVQYLSQTMESFKSYITENRVTTEFDLIEKIKECLSIQSGVISSNNIKVINKFDSEIKINSFPNEFIQALISIVNNSIDALKIIHSESRAIIIEVANYENNIIINVKDTGGGFKENMLESIFEPYITTKHKSMGIGLGLYTVYKIITSNMNGTILASNEEIEFKNNIYTGANIQIELPKN